MGFLERFLPTCVGSTVLILIGLSVPSALAQPSDLSASADPQVAATQDAAEPERVRVFFATNRQRVKVGKPDEVFGGERGESAFGICQVEFKSIPGAEAIARKMPFYIPTESSHQRIEVQVHEEAFWDRLAAAVEASQTPDVVVFIHGYSYDFERACDRAAETQRVLADRATVLLFTWPSNGSPTDYSSDRSDLDWSVPFLARILRQLADRWGAENIQVMAHSLGSRGIVRALVGLTSEGVKEPLLGQLVLLAPDLDAEEFLQVLPDVEPLSGKITLYASGNDTPLKFSRKVNGSPRLGEAGEFLTVVEGMETVDVTPAGRYQYLGHEYFYFHPLVVADLAELVTIRAGAGARAAPRPRSRDGLTYWEIVAEEER